MNLFKNILKQFLIVTSITISATSLYAQKTPIPANYSIVAQVTGDLNKDNIDELVIVYNTHSGDEFENIKREIIIYKQTNEKWIVWKRSTQAIMSSQSGGMSGDPFESMKIEKGILLISQSGGGGGSRWGHTDKYRFQHGDFYLIGYSSSSEIDCEESVEIDFNISNGKMIVKKEFLDCSSSTQKINKTEQEELVKKGIKITLQHRNNEDITIVTPKYENAVHLSRKDR